MSAETALAFVVMCMVWSITFVSYGLYKLYRLVLPVLEAISDQVSETGSFGNSREDKAE